MPKVRDLGISFIPATMRPLEIGDGGGGTPPCEPSGACKDPSCHEPSFGDCQEPSYGDCEPRSAAPCEPSGCGRGASCIEPSSDGYGGDDDKKDKTKQYLSAASIGQLRQQMQSRLGA